MNNEDIDLSQLLQYVWAHIWLIIIMSSLTFALGVFYVLKRPAIFQADVLLQIDDRNQGNPSVTGLSKKLDLGTNYEDNAAIHAALIQSRFILEPVIDTLHLNIKLEPYRSFFKKIFPANNSPKIEISDFRVPTEQINKTFILKTINSNFLNLSDKKGKILLQGGVGSLLSNSDKSIFLKVKKIQGQVASKFLLSKESNSEVMQKILNHLRIKDLGTKEATGVLQISLRGSQPKQMVKILNTIALQAQHKDIEKKSREAEKALNFLEQQLPLAKAALDKAETELNLYRATSGKIDIKLQTQSLLTELAELDKQLGTLRVNKIDMLQRYTKDHPFLIGLNEQIKGEELKKKQLEKRLKKLPASDQIAVNLMRDVEVKNALYLILLNKAQELEFIKAGTVSNVRILSTAKIPDEPLPSRNQLILGGSVLLGLALSLLVLFLRHLLSAQISDPHWGERHLDLVNLAIVPYCPDQAQNIKKRRLGKLGTPPILANVNSHHVAIEALRSLRTNLQVSLCGASNNIIAILGISSGIGKTFISCNLAWLLAVSGKKVLLIDGDLRRGVIHKNFNLDQKPGFVDLLNHNENINTVLKPSGHPNLTIIPRGAYTADPAELLMKNTSKIIINKLAEEFDIVVIDTAPTLLVTDGALIANIAATNLLVLGANAHHPNELIMVMKRLSNAGVVVQGSIFNFFKASAKNHTFSKYHAYYDDTVTST